ncbi:MAG: hypothetical protein Q9170_007652 [Blastenia crenularia]
MPATDPTFQHSDEDWTQITQPRLRKRVQNRVSQRKHRNKIRQQRASSIDAGNNASAPVSATEYWPPNGALSSNEGSITGERQSHPRGCGSPEQSLLETSLLHDPIGLDGLDHNLLDGCPPWTGSAAPLYPQASSYPAGPSYTASDSSQLPEPYALPSLGSSKGPATSTTGSSSIFDNGAFGVESSPYDYLQYLQQWYIPPAYMMPTSYTTRNDSTSNSSQQQPQPQSYGAWVPQRACEFGWPSSSAGPPPIPIIKPSDPTGSSYHPSSRTPSVSARTDIGGIPTPPNEVNTSSRYVTSRTIPARESGIEPRGSGINPTKYKSGKHSHASRSK